MKKRLRHKWKFQRLVRSLSDQEEVKKKLNELERDRERVKLYIQRTRNYKPIATIYDARDFKGDKECQGT